MFRVRRLGEYLAPLFREGGHGWELAPLFSGARFFVGPRAFLVSLGDPEAAEAHCGPEAAFKDCTVATATVLAWQDPRYNDFQDRCNIQRLVRWGLAGSELQHGCSCQNRVGSHFDWWGLAGLDHDLRTSYLRTPESRNRIYISYIYIYIQIWSKRDFNWSPVHLA